MSFEDDITKLLKKKYYTPAELAEKTGLSLSSVYRIVDRLSKKYDLSERSERVGARGPETKSWRIG
jgi:DNA-binding MarR family transcriptional regulator